MATRVQKLDEAVYISYRANESWERYAVNYFLSNYE